MIRKGNWKRRQKGQAIVEYVILVVVVALAAFFVLTMFSDRLREMISGATEALGGAKSGTYENKDKSAEEIVKGLTKDGNIE